MKLWGYAKKAIDKNIKQTFKYYLVTFSNCQNSFGLAADLAFLMVLDALLTEWACISQHYFQASPLG